MTDSSVKLRYPEKWIQDSIEAQQLLVQLHSCRRQLNAQIGLQAELAEGQNLSSALVCLDESHTSSKELIDEIHSIKQKLHDLMLDYWHKKRQQPKKGPADGHL